MAAEMKGLYQFGPYHLEVARRRLMRDGEVVPVSSKVFETLLLLVQNHDRVMVKDELMQAVWPDSFVEEVNLAQHISALRKALGEAPGENRYIATIPGRGYRFVADVQALQAEDSEIFVQRQTTATLVIEEEEEVKTPLGAEGEPGRTLTGTIVRSRKTRNLALLGALAIVIVVVGVFLWRGRQRAATTRLHSLAVLPFQPLTAQDDQYLGLGLTDAVITRLSEVRRLIVRPTSSVLRYADAKSDPLQAGRSLGVESVLDGTVQKVGDHLRVTVQMLDVKDGHSLWAETFDENFTNIFNVEDIISQKVVAALPVELAGQEKKQLARNSTDNPEAYENYVKGRYSEFQSTSDGLTKAITYFNRAIALDPGYAVAYAGLADAYTMASEVIMPPSEAYPKAEAAARKALAIDENLADAHAALAHSLLHQWKLTDAGREFQRALELNPNNTAFYYAYAEYLAALGRYDDAVAATRRRFKLDPLSTESYSMMAWADCLKRDYEHQLAAGEKALQIDPNDLGGIWNVATAHLFQGKYPEAIAEFRKAAAVSDDHPVAMAGLAAAYARSGDKAAALKVIDGLKQQSAQRYIPPLNIAVAYGEVGDMDQAFAWMDKAYDDHSEPMLLLNSAPNFDPLRADPRFQKLVQRVAEKTQKN